MADIKNHVSLPTSLVAFWDFEETATSGDVTRYDLVGANNLTSNNSVLSGTGKIGNDAVFVDANAEYLSIADNAALSITGDISFSCWVKPQDTGLHILINKYNSTGNQRGYQAYLNGGTDFTVVLSSAGTSGVTKTVTSTFSADTWYHLVFTFTASASEGRFYVNGSQVGATQTYTGVTSIYNNNAEFLVGANEIKTSGNCSDMNMDELGVWSKVLTSTEVTDLYNGGAGLPYYYPDDILGDTTLTTNLKAFYELADATAASSWVDSHTGAIHLTNVSSGSGVTSATGITPKSGTGLGADFNKASNEYLRKTTPTAGTLTGWTGNFSFSFWIKVETLPTSGQLYGIAGCWNFGGGDAGNDWLLYYENNAGTPRLALQWNEETAHGTSASYPNLTLTTGTWFHIAVVADTDTPAVTWYVNGVSYSTSITSTAADNGSVNIGGASFFLGAYNHSSPSSFMDGVIDEMAIYNKSLTIGEVRALYGYGVPPPYEESTGSTQYGALALLGVG